MVLTVLKVFKVKLVLPAQLVTLVLTEQMVMTVLKAFKGKLVKLDHKEYKGKLVQQEQEIIMTF
jgi:hypothetical protein